VDGVPILINEANSIFRVEDYLSRGSTSIGGRSDSRSRRAIRSVVAKLPQIGQNIRARENFLRFGRLLASAASRPKVLVLGGRGIGEGFDAILFDSRFAFLETDASLGPRVMLVCDAHDLPFADQAFDGVIAQAVLEHTLDPYRCVEEMRRVLSTRGLVYAETPFMQQVHGGRYDFTRFTHLGHRRVFRRFEEIDSGATCGPGMALAWAYKYFLLSAVKSDKARWLVTRFAEMTSFWLKFLDPWLIERPGTLDAASAYFFIGRASGDTLADQDLVRQYRGGIRTSSSSWTGPRSS
jgi:SAM-dependent methyltransferase